MLENMADHRIRLSPDALNRSPDARAILARGPEYLESGSARKHRRQPLPRTVKGPESALARMHRDRVFLMQLPSLRHWPRQAMATAV